MTALAHLSASRIIRSIADACARWSDADFPPRVQCLDAIAQRTGYSTTVIEYALDTIFDAVDEMSLRDIANDELGALGVLDAFTTVGSLQRRAVPIGTVCIIASRTTIGVALFPLLLALTAKCDVTIKDREDGLVRAFLGSLVQEDALFASAARTVEWDATTDAHDLTVYDAVVAFGDDATLGKIRAQCAPSARFIGFGSKASAGYIAADSLCDKGQLHEFALRAARDVLLYDSQGCLSLQILFLEHGGSLNAHTLAHAIAEAADAIAPEFPPSRRNAHDESRITSIRALATLRSALGRGEIITAPQANATFVINAPREDPPPFATRTLLILEVTDTNDALSYLRAHGVALEAIALASATPDLREELAQMGVSRICAFGELQRPPLREPHGGRPRMLDFVHLSIADHV